jgi:hypothetical protein
LILRKNTAKSPPKSHGLILI